MTERRWPRPRLARAAYLALALAGCGRTTNAKTPDVQVDAAVPAPSATIARAHGSVWLLTPAGERQAVNGGTLSEGDVLATGGGGGAVVVLGPGREVELQSNGRIKLRRQDGHLAVEVDSGDIVSRTPGDQEVALAILTPFGITRVPAGSEAHFGIAADRVRIDVAVGQLHFTDATGQVTSAQANEAIEVKLGNVQLLRDPGSGSTGKTLDLVLAADNGTLFVRRPGERGFSPQRGGGPAPGGTQYRIDAPDGRARLLAPGLRAQLERKAAGHIGEATRSPAGRRYALALERGSATIALEAGEAHEVVLADQAGSAPITLRATEATTFTVTAGPRGTSLAVLAGAAELSVGETRQRLETGTRADISGDSVQLGKRPQADVILPTSRGQRVYADLLGDVTLSWPASTTTAPTAAPGSPPGHPAGALLEVARDSAFKDLVLAGRVTGNTVTIPAPSRSELHWRVTPAHGQEPLLGSVRFAPDIPLSVLDLDHPRNLVSESSPVTTVHFQGAPPALTFSYAAHRGAARYRLRLYRADTPERPLVERVVGETRCAIEPGSLREGNYLWHAVPLDGRGTELAGGRMNKLELVYDNALTRLAIGSPKQGQAPSGPEINAQGAAPLGSKLYINGKLARLDEKGRFSARVARSPAVVFRLVGKNGAESYWIRKLRLARGAPAAKARR